MTVRDAGRAPASRRAEAAGGSAGSRRVIPFSASAASGSGDHLTIHDPEARAIIESLSDDLRLAAVQALQRCAEGDDATISVTLCDDPSTAGWRLSARWTEDGGLSAALLEEPAAREAVCFQALVENAPYQLTFRDPDRRFVLINAASATANRIDPTTLLGRTSAALGHDLGAQWDDITAHVIRTRETLQYLEFGSNEDGRPNRRYLTIKYPAYDDGGRFLGVGTCSLDMTEIDNESYRLRQMLDELPEAVFAYDAEGEIIACNRAGYALVCPERAYAGRTDDETRRRFRALDWRTETGRPFTGCLITAAETETPIVGLVRPADAASSTAEDAVLWFEATSRPAVGSGPTAPAGVLFLRPFDETMKLRAAQRESERWFRLLAENAIDMIAVIGPDRRIRYASPSFKRVLGYEPEALLGGSLFDLMAPHERARMKLRCEQILGGVELGPVELIAYDVDGDPRVLECTARMVSGDVAVVVSLHDVTERRAAEEGRHILERVLEGVTQGLCLFDALRDEPLTYNLSFSRLLGVPGQGARAFWRRMLADPETPEARALLEALDRRVSYFGVVTVRAARTGAVTPIRTTIDWIDDPDTGAPRFVACQCDDYSREYARLKGLEQAYAKERKAHVGKAEMMKALGHDLRQPIFALGLIAGAVSPLVEEREPELAAALVRSVDSLRRMLGDLAEASALSAHGVTPHPRRFALRPLMERVVEEFRPVAHEAGMTLALAEGRQPETLVSDPDLIFRILRNLVANAIDHSGGRRVSLDARLAADGVVIEVADDGQGVPADLAPRIFDDYVRRARKGGDGLGLGLSIVKGAAELLGGEVQLHAPPSGGARFIVRLPELGEAGAQGDR